MILQQTYDLLKPIVAQLDVSVVCQSMTTNMDGDFVLLCKNTKWLTKDRQITIVNVTYDVIDITPNVSVTLRGASAPVVISFNIDLPQFEHGTVLSSKLEYDLKSEDYKDKLPLIWLKDVYSENVYISEEDSRDRDSDCELYFMINSDYENWLNTQHDLYAIQPMRNLINEFIATLKRQQFIDGDIISTGLVKNLARWGTYIDAKGNTGLVFNDNLSGASLRITIPFLKNTQCCAQGLDTRPAPGYVLDQNGNIIAELHSNEIYTVQPGGVCSPVTIKNIEDGSTIAQVQSGGEYFVQLFDGIEDTIDNNTVTIIDPLNN